MHVSTDQAPKQDEAWLLSFSRMRDNLEKVEEKKLSKKTQQEADDALQLLDSRRSIYAFLARVFEKEVSITFLKQCTSKENPLLQMASNDNPAEGEGDKELGEGFRELTKYLNGTSRKDLTSTKLELDIEYANLFLGVKGKPPHPSESVYTTEDHLLMQKARDEVMFAYRAAGVDKVTEFREPEDHIAIELQFMAFLCEKTARAFKARNRMDVEKFLKMQEDFLIKHLSLWVPGLTKDILESGTVEFYRGAAKILDGFVKADSGNVAYLEESILAK